MFVFTCMTAKQRKQNNQLFIERISPFLPFRQYKIQEVTLSFLQGSDFIAPKILTPLLHTFLLYFFVSRLFATLLHFLIFTLSNQIPEIQFPTKKKKNKTSSKSFSRLYFLFIINSLNCILLI
jgi:hypothetical protein